MEIRIRFEGGPIDGEAAKTTALQAFKVFFPPTERRVIVYRRNPLKDELLYSFDSAMSDTLTAKYDQTKAWFDQNEEPGVVAWEEPEELTELEPGEGEDKIIPFSDTPIEDEDGQDD